VANTKGNFHGRRKLEHELDCFKRDENVYGKVWVLATPGLTTTEKNDEKTPVCTSGVTAAVLSPVSVSIDADGYSISFSRCRDRKLQTR